MVSLFIFFQFSSLALREAKRISKWVKPLHPTLESGFTLFRDNNVCFRASFVVVAILVMLNSTRVIHLVKRRWFFPPVRQLLRPENGGGGRGGWQAY